MDEKIFIKTICKNCITIIDKGIFLFVFILFKKLFLVSSSHENDNYKINKKLKEWIVHINKKIIQEKEKYINEEYTKENLKNIFDLIISQNRIYASEIIEGILIYIFSMFFLTDKDINLNKYLNRSRLREFNFQNVMDISKINQSEIRNIRVLLVLDRIYLDHPDKNGYYFDKETVNSKIFNILYDILSLKFSDVIRELRNPNKIIYYINKYIYNLEENQYNDLAFTITGESNYFLLGDYNENPLFVNEFCYKHKFDVYTKVPIPMLNSFLWSAFIYHMNKTSPLIKYINPMHENEENKDLAYIPFEYNLEGAYIEEKYSNTIISPLRFEPRITKLNLRKNSINRFGLYELGKLLIFNKNIKSMNLDINFLTDKCLEYINLGMRIYENHSLEELILSKNNLTTQSGIFLAQIITKFRGLKTLDLYNNELKWGLSPFFAILKKLYRKGKTQLECLILNNCQLDDESFYELGELINSKHCKLKKLYLRGNKYNVNLSHFLKKLKRNNSITEIYLGQTLIYNNNTDEIIRIISNAQIKNLYLNKVKINSFNELIRIIYRTKIIKSKYDVNINKNESSLINLDLSDNEIYFKAPIYIKLLIEVLENNTIRCLDISHILYGLNVKKYNKNLKNNKYINEVEKLIKLLEEKKRINNKKMKEINKYKVEIERNKNLEKEEIFNELDLDKIIKNNNAKYPLFLRKEANKIIKDKFKDINDLNKRKEIETKLILFMILKKAKYDLSILEHEIKDKKLIII